MHGTGRTNQVVFPKQLKNNNSYALKTFLQDTKGSSPNFAVDIDKFKRLN